MPNKITNFWPCNTFKHWQIKKLPILASAAYEQGTALRSSLGTDYQIMDGSSETNFAGILAETISASDADYATSGKLKHVFVPISPEAEMYFTVGNGTFSGADVGKNVAVHTDGKSVAVDTAGTHFQIRKYISATRGKCAPLRLPSAT